MLDKTGEYLKMSEVETELWWYKALHYRILNEIIRNYEAKKDIHILDSGCGTGGLMLFLKGKGYTNITGFDLSEVALDFCRRKQLIVSKEDVFEYEVNHKGMTFDVIVSSDVLCYIDLDKHQKIIDDFYKMLKPGGILLINLPAFNVFKGEHDIAVGLLRRYNIGMVKSLFLKPGINKTITTTRKKQSFAKLSNHTFSNVEIYCWPFLLSPLILINRLFQKVRLLLNLSSGTKSDVELPLSFINLVFFELCKFEVNKLRYRNWGSSIFIRLKK